MRIIFNIFLLIFLFSNPCHAWFGQSLGIGYFNNNFVNVSGDDMTGDLQTVNLIVTGTATVQGNAFSVGSSTLTVYDGKIGIGEAAPSEKLEIKDGSIKISTTSGNQGIYWQNNELQIEAYAPICVTSNSVNGTSIASTAYIAVATATLTNMVGGKMLTFSGHLAIDNGAGASRDYDISLRENGVEIDLYDDITVGGSSTILVPGLYHTCNSPSGTNLYSVWIKSDSAIGTQEAKHIRLLVFEK